MDTPYFVIYYALIDLLYSKLYLVFYILSEFYL